MSLEAKTICVFAATGSIGGVTAKHLAAQGAHVHVSGRDETALKELTEEIAGAGGRATAGVVDATDEAAVIAYLDGVAGATGRIDGVFNAIGATPEQLGYPAVSTELDLDTFFRPLHLILGSTFLTSRVAARHMAAQGGGSIVTLSASISGTFVPWMAALTATCGAIEALTRQLAFEFAPTGVRVNCARGDAMPDTRTIPLTLAGSAAIAGIAPEAYAQMLPPVPLGRPVSTRDTAAVVAFLLSDATSAISSQVIDVSSKALV